MQYLTRQKIPMHVVIKTINVVSLLYLYLNFHFRLKSEDDNSDYRNILLKSKQRTFSVIYSLYY